MLIGATGVRLLRNYRIHPNPLERGIGGDILLREPVPIQAFVRNCFELSEIKSVIDQWPIETDVLLQIACSHFKEMGILSIDPASEQYIRSTFLEFIYSSPEVTKRILEAERRERQLARTRRNNQD